MNLFNRYDPAKHYDRHLFLPDRILQSAELNELQSNLTARTADIASAFFSDGAIFELIPNARGLLRAPLRLEDMAALVQHYGEKNADAGPK